MFKNHFNFLFVNFFIYLQIQTLFNYPTKIHEITSSFIFSHFFRYLQQNQQPFNENDFLESVGRILGIFFEDVRELGIYFIFCLIFLWLFYFYFDIVFVFYSLDLITQSVLFGNNGGEKKSKIHQKSYAIQFHPFDIHYFRTVHFV